MAELALRLLPWHARGHGLRPGQRRRGRTSSCRPAATRTSPTSGCSRRRSGRSSSTPTTSTRRFRRHGSGTSSGSRRASSLPGRGNGFSAGDKPGRHDGSGPRLPRVDGPLSRAMRLLDIWYASDHRSTTSVSRRGGRTLASLKDSAAGRRKDRGDLQQGHGDGTRSRRSKSLTGARRRPPGHRRRSARVHARRDPRRLLGPRARSSQTTGPRLSEGRRAASSSATGSSTSRSRSSASGASGRGASSSSSRARRG